jgi:hypothetical protein
MRSVTTTMTNRVITVPSTSDEPPLIAAELPRPAMRRASVRILS